MQKIKLKKCPFCKAEIQEYEIVYTKEIGYAFHHYCNKKTEELTLNISVYAKTLDELIKIWNKRKLLG